MGYRPTLHTIIFVSAFLVAYLVILIKNVKKNAIDFYDLLMLSTVAIVPSIFVFFPGTVSYLAKLTGVAFPFLLLFGLLFLIVFVYLYSLVIKIKNLDNRSILLIQELSLLRKELQQRKGKIQEEDE